MIKKGDKVAREDVRCTECDQWFSRAVVHPYINKCPSCRKGKPIKRERFECCGEVWRHREGMYICPTCRRQWWVLPDGWYRLDKDIYWKGQYRGSWEQYGDLRRIIDGPKVAV